MIYAFENKDYVKSYSFYDDKAHFFSMGNINPNGISLEEQKAMDKKILQKFDITSIDAVGYPDYLHYELCDARTVLSWWNYNLIRKSDKKAIFSRFIFPTILIKTEKLLPKRLITIRHYWINLLKAAYCNANLQPI